MNELYLETAGGEGLVAIVRDGAIAARRETTERLAHGRETVALIASLASDAQIPLSSLNRVVWNAGPGSFTGMRIGAAIAQTIRYTHGTPVLSLSMLDILAWVTPLDGPASLGALTTPVIDHADRPEGEAGSSDTKTNLTTPRLDIVPRPEVAFAPEAYIAPVLDARQHEFYAALYRRGAEYWHPVLPPGRFAAADLAPRLPYNTVVIGSGAAAWRAAAETVLGAPVAVVMGRDGWARPSIEAMIRLAARLTALGVKPDPAPDRTSPVMPQYLRPPSVTLADGVHEVSPGSPPVKDDPIKG